MAAELRLGPTTSAYVNTADGPTYVGPGGVLPDNLAPGELDRLRDAGTDIVDPGAKAGPRAEPKA